VGALVVIAVVPVVLLAVAGGRRPRGEDVGLAASGRLGFTVAIADTGLDLEHPDHAPSLRGDPDERDGHGNDDDANGSVDDLTSPTRRRRR
jgi:subtilase family protein